MFRLLFISLFLLFKKFSSFGNAEDSAKYLKPSGLKSPRYDSFI